MEDKKIVTVVAALIRKDSHFLICQRPPHKARGLLWEFPGGKVEAGETPKEALQRECREELDVEVLPGRLFICLTHDYPDLTVCLYLYEAEILEGAPKMLEHADMRWITPEEIPDFEFCPADVKILQKISTEWR